MPNESPKNGGQTDAKVRPLFGFRFSQAGAVVQEHYLPDPAETPASEQDDTFLWVHLDLSDPSMVDWLLRLAIPSDVREAVSRPIPRGRVFTLDTLIYGQLRDLRVPTADEGSGRQSAALSLLIIPGLVVTGGVEPLTTVERLRERIVAGAAKVGSPISLLTEFFISLNLLGEQALDEASENVGQLGSRMLRSQRSFEQRHDLPRMRQQLLQTRVHAMNIARDMAYKRTAMLELLRECPPISEPGDYRELRREIDRYNALIEDIRDFADRCQSILDEQRAQVEEAASRNLYILTIFSAVFMPATLIAGMWGMNVSWLPFGVGAYGFWEISALVALSVGVVLLWVRLMRIL
ncbi:CorA family divalent cation transporter [Ensifer sp. SSB1]|uniref:CorA family divalent cation transporter n=1 Tax=Ensifer sp. SSB1 TaxID=2795385 RepID=UPI001A4ABDF5|nr:CorA family divalent cation transporter [Ensifer sp. SSB1]MBK5571026.1 hypothetical protein [Ensifer sp. SSB1]